MTRAPFRIDRALTRFCGAALLMAACGGPQKAGGAGTTCFRDDDCEAGLICVAPMGTFDRVCSSDPTPLVSNVEGPPPTEGGTGGMAGGGNGGVAAGGMDAAGGEPAETGGTAGTGGNGGNGGATGGTAGGGSGGTDTAGTAGGGTSGTAGTAPEGGAPG